MTRDEGNSLRTYAHLKRRVKVRHEIGSFVAHHGHSTASTEIGGKRKLCTRQSLCTRKRSIIVSVRHRSYGEDDRFEIDTDRCLQCSLTVRPVESSERKESKSSINAVARCSSAYGSRVLKSRDQSRIRRRTWQKRRHAEWHRCAVNGGVELNPLALVRQFLEDDATAVQRAVIDILHVEQVVVEEGPALPA